MTTLPLNSPSATDLLLTHLSDRAGVIAQLIAPSTVELSLLGSFNSDAMQLEIVLLVRAWETATRVTGIDVRVDLEDSAQREAGASQPHGVRVVHD